jgi:phage tail-like protein
MSVAEKPVVPAGMALQPRAAATTAVAKPAAPTAPPMTVDHVASTGRCYPGETVTLHTKVQALTGVAGFAVQVGVPNNFRLEAHRCSDNAGSGGPDVFTMRRGRVLRWRLPRPVEAGETFEYEVDVAPRPVQTDTPLVTQAQVWVDGAGSDARPIVEAAELRVLAKGRYLRYLPRIYQEQDELMGRFLMLFESFWAPIEGQIDSLPNYFDPALTPLKLLPWLAAWVDLTLDDHWPEAKRRQLLKAAVSLYRKRGTRRGLIEYLELYTGAQVKISEHGARNFLLGPAARLGPGVALGTLNMPHTFTVTVYLPPAEDEGRTSAEQERYETDRRRMIESIIESEKPAHTSYVLRLEAQLPERRASPRKTS